MSKIKLSDHFPGINLKALNPAEHTHVYVVQVPRSIEDGGHLDGHKFKAIPACIRPEHENMILSKAEEQMAMVSAHLVGVYEISRFDLS